MTARSQMAALVLCLGVLGAGLPLVAGTAAAQVYPPPPPDLPPAPPVTPPLPPLRAPPPPPPSPPPSPSPAPPPPATMLSPTGARPGNVIGTGQSLPTSGQSSNTTPADTQSVIAPRLPEPPLDANSPPIAFLAAARQALAAGRTGEAQEALERAESRSLDRSVRPSQADQASRQPLVRMIADARHALAAGDRARTFQLIDAAMSTPGARMR